MYDGGRLIVLVKPVSKRRCCVGSVPTHRIPIAGKISPLSTSLES